MKKNFKKIYGYAIIMGLFVAAIVLLSVLSENKLENYQEQYEKEITGSQTQIELLEEQIVLLSEENAKLKDQLEEAQKLETNLVTKSQALSDMKDIYELYKKGKAAEARGAFEKIEPMGFDDACLAYYELLKDMLD